MPSIVAAGLVFAASAAVLVLEILAGRLLAPFVGVSLETYTGIIGVVLAGISLGTWLGGRAADHTDPRRLLGPLLITGGALALLIVPLISFVAALRPGEGPAAIVLFSLAGFFLPAAVLSAVGPTVVKLQLRSLDETGRVVGRLSAIGTAGAIVGTFVTGFVLIAAVPTRPIVTGVGALLVVAGLSVWMTIGRGAGGTSVPLAALAALMLGAAWSAVSPQPCQVESTYFCIRVEVAGDRPTGRTLFLDTLRHSYVDLADPRHLEFEYTRIVGDVVAAVAPEGTPIRVLHIGGGGFTLPRYVAATRPGSSSRVLELDATVVRVDREQLGLVLSPELEVRIGDARLGIGEEPASSYDLVVGDAFGKLAVPWHLTTQEMVREVQRVLRRPGGIYVVNVIDYPPLSFGRAEAATLRSVFAHVGHIGRPDPEGRERGGNVMLVASDAPLPVAAIDALNARRRGMDSVRTGAQLDAFIGEAIILTDDFAPVDQLLTSNLRLIGGESATWTR